METIVLYPDDEKKLQQVLALASESKINAIRLDEEEQKKLAGILLANLAKKNPTAYATDEEILSVVEEARQERYGK